MTIKLSRVISFRAGNGLTQGIGDFRVALNLTMKVRLNANF